MKKYYAILLLLASICVHGQVSNKKTDRILIQEVAFTGAATLDNTLLNEIKSSATAREMLNEPRDISDMLRDAFQQRGYFDAEISRLKIRPLDALARPMPVRVEAEVSEGPRFTFSGFKFVGNSNIKTQQLLATFPLHAGDEFDTAKVRSGLESLMKLYHSNGHLDFLPIPKTEKVAASKMLLEFDIEEGPQYRMGALQIEGDAELAELLQKRWELKPGQVFDAGYPARFLEENKSSLPADIHPGNIVVARDCRDNTVAVFLPLGSGTSGAPHDEGCDAQKSGAKAAKP